MIFTRLAQLVAFAALAFGAFNILMGFAIATGYVGPYEAALARYSTASSSGQLIDKGFVAILFAIALGTMAEISVAMRKRSTCTE